jgi:uncharacterized protein (TIGR04255 family)
MTTIARTVGTMADGVPLQEAYLEIILERDPLPRLDPSALYELIRGDYPTYEQIPLLLVPYQQLPFGTNLAPAALRFYSPAGDACIQYGPRLLSLNMLKYTSIDDFVDRLQDVYSALKTVIAERKLERVGLAYINNIPDSADVVRPFHVLPEHLKGQDLKVMQLDVAAGDVGSGNVLLNKVQPIQGSAMLQLTIFNTDDRTIGDKDALSDWIRLANQAIKAMFYECLTDTGRTLYRKVFEVAARG